jgi:membrane fusion protein (multidrug efflux system)
MKLDFTVPAVHLASLKPDLSIEARSPAFPDRRFEGTVYSVDSRINAATRAIAARALLPNPERLLKPGLLMTINLLKNPREVLVVPEAALVPSAGENDVFVVDPAAAAPLAERRRVVIGARRVGEVEIRQGLAAGEFVVVHGTLRVRPGQPVSVTAIAESGMTLEALLNAGKGERE